MPAVVSNNYRITIWPKRRQPRVVSVGRLSTESSDRLAPQRERLNMNLCGWDGIPSHKRIPVTCLVLCSIAASQASDTDIATSGFEAAKTKCARCHVIGEYNRMGGIGNAPRFSPWHNMKTYGNVFLRFTRDARTRPLSGSLDMPSGQMRFLNIRNSRFLRRNQCTVCLCRKFADSSRLDSRSCSHY